MTANSAYILDNMTYADTPALLRIARDPDFFYPYFHQNGRPVWRGVLRFMWLMTWTRLRRPRHWFKAIRAPDGTFIGCVLILDLHVIERGLGEIAYFVGKPWQGQDIGTRAVISTVRWAQQHCGLERLFANVDPDNPASAAILRKLGMRKVKDIPAEFSLFSDRAGNPRPRDVMLCTAEELAQALTAQSPVNSFPVK